MTKSKPKSLRIRIYFTLLILLNVSLIIPPIALFAKSIYTLQWTKTDLNQDFTIYTIPPSTPLSTIADELAKRKIISDKPAFLKWMMRFNFDRRVQSGRFKFKNSDSLWAVMKKLCKQTLSRLTIPEGLTAKQIANILKSHGINEKRFLSLLKDKTFIYELGLNTTHLEGYLFPDTYKISYAENEKKIIKMLVERFKEVVSTLDLDNSIIYNTRGLYSGVKMASLIEREVGHPADRTKISSVFWNRIRQNWRLDSDVTIHYLIDNWQRKLTKKDLKIDSPYNTRKYKGLPPTPICSPGKASLEAAFFPDKASYMFFVANGESNGKCIFTKTLKEHNRAVKKLRKQGKI